MSTIEQLTAERDEARAALERERIGHCFAGSRLVAEQLSAPPAMVAATFAKHFCLEHGRAVAIDVHGNTILSRSRLGEPADFDEALDVLIDASGYADRLRKAPGQATGGAAEAWRPNRPTLTRQGFDALLPAEKMAFVKAGGTLSE